MPRPTDLPSWIAVEATIIPTLDSRMANVRGQSVSPRTFATEHKITDFKILSFEDNYLVVSGNPLHTFHIEYSNARYHWREGQAPPAAAVRPSWLRVGTKMRWQGKNPCKLFSLAPVVKEGSDDGTLTVLYLFAQHLEATVSGFQGIFRVDINASFSADWAVAAENHNARVKIAPFIQVGRRIRPADLNGDMIGLTSYLVNAVDPHAGVFQVAPLLGDGIVGRNIILGLWNSAEAWCLAPDDHTKAKFVAGMKMRNSNGVEFEILHVNDLTGDMKLKDVRELTVQKGQLGWHLVIPNEPQEVVKSRFERLEEDESPALEKPLPPSGKPTRRQAPQP